MATECEAKLRVDDLAPIRARLEQLGGGDKGDAFERNWVLDRPDNSLLHDGTLLRVRNTGGAGGILTVKRKSRGGEFKTREEVESTVDSTETLVRQLEMIGFRVAWIYEKFRATWLWQDCVVSLDECPEMGCFVEIEGAPENIRKTAADLGLDPEQHLAESYPELWRNRLREKGEKPRHMIFSQDDPALSRHPRAALPPPREK
jgi:predicted adenylyl cyclase CyaB